MILQGLTSTQPTALSICLLDTSSFEARFSCQLCGWKGGKTGREKLNWVLNFSHFQVSQIRYKIKFLLPWRPRNLSNFQAILLSSQGLPGILTFISSSRLVRWLLWSEKISESSSNISILSLWRKMKKQISNRDSGNPTPKRSCHQFLLPVKTVWTSGFGVMLHK